MKINRVQNHRTVMYEFPDYESARTVFDEWKQEFRRDNKSDTVKKDKEYNRYAKELDKTLETCYHRCPKCPPEEHEGPLKMFCRCEGRNIKLAKKLRLEYDYSACTGKNEEKVKEQSLKEINVDERE